MDTTKNGSTNVSSVQEPLVRPEENAKQKKLRLKWQKASQRWRAAHPNYYKKAIAKWRAKNPEKVRAYHKKWYTKHYKEHGVKTKLYYQKNKSKYSQRQRERRKEVKEKLFAAYGGKVCRCCGETMEEFLSIDHINGNGNRHRKSIRPSGRNQSSANFYEWLRKENFPSGFQILCMQCNFAKGKYGVCPHENTQTPIDIFFEH